TPGGLARAVHLPSDAQVEAAVSVYETNPASAADTKFRVTATEASARLWDCIPSGDEKFTGRRLPSAESIHTLRWDADLPASTASKIRALWIATLRKTQPEQCVNCVSVDSSVEIFSAVDSKNEHLEGQISKKPGKTTLGMVKIAFALMQYARADAHERPALAKNIERDATALLSAVSTR
ncbi:MAG TPA: hypothetical protein VFA58_06740, partial [Chthoniobacterales bacterium]|nr:hypothetical protein [Chthoniobacterales bacterium]